MTPKGYTTRQQVENYLLITVDESFHEQVDTWIAQAETMIETITGRTFITDATESARLFDGLGARWLAIDDAVAISKIEILAADGTVEDTIENESGKDKRFYTYPCNGREPIRSIELGQGWLGSFSRGQQNIRITGRWGSTTGVPADIMFAATVLAAGIVKVGADAEGEVQSMTIGRYTVTYRTQDQMNDLKIAEATLARYKRYGNF